MRPQVFKLKKNFENRKIHQRRRSAWVGQADFEKLERNNRNQIGNYQGLSGNVINLKIFETIPEIFWPSRFRSDEQFTSFNDLRLSTFLRELFTVEQITVYPGKYSQRLVTIRAKCGLRSQALYFLYLSHPPETGKGGKRSYDRTTKSYVLWYLAYFSWEVQTTTSDSH